MCFKFNVMSYRGVKKSFLTKYLSSILSDWQVGLDSINHTQCEVPKVAECVQNIQGWSISRPSLEIDYRRYRWWLDEEPSLLIRTCCVFIYPLSEHIEFLFIYLYLSTLGYFWSFTYSVLNVILILLSMIDELVLWINNRNIILKVHLNVNSLIVYLITVTVVKLGHLKYWFKPQTIYFNFSIKKILSCVKLCSEARDVFKMLVLLNTYPHYRGEESKRVSDLAKSLFEKNKGTVIYHKYNLRPTDVFGNIAKFKEYVLIFFLNNWNWSVNVLLWIIISRFIENIL